MKKYVSLIDKYILTSKTDLDGNITYMSEAFVRVSAYSKEDLMAKNHRLIRHPDMPDSIFKEIWEIISN